ncbi:MAG: regulatory protein RecX [Gemmatimonadales bacterium]
MTAEKPDTSPTYEEAWDAALSYLSYRARSRRELERHLRRKGYPSSLADRVLDRCEELALLDDLSFATGFVRDRIKLRPRGVRRLEAELVGKGVSRDDARQGIRAAFEEEEVTERDLLEVTARRRWRSLARLDARTARRRLYAHLVRSGFPPDEVQRAVAQIVQTGPGLTADPARDES